MNKILVLIDYSECSKKALMFALQLARKSKAVVHLLHVQHVPKKKGTKLMHKMQEVSRDEDRKMVDKSTSKFLKGLKYGAELNTVPIIRYGDVAKQAVNESIQGGFSLMVIGTKGATRLKEAFVGSNAFKTLKLTMIPTVVVPFAYKIDAKNKKACVALKFDALYSDICVRLLTTSKDLGFKPNVITVVNGKSESIDMDLRLNGKKHNLEIYNNKLPSEAISKYIKDEEVGLLALHYNAYSFFRELTHQSVTSQFTFRSSIPILFMK